MKCGISYPGNKFCDGCTHAHTHTRTHGWTDGHHSYGPPPGVMGDKNVYAKANCKLDSCHRMVCLTGFGLTNLICNKYEVNM